MAVSSSFTGCVVRDVNFLSPLTCFGCMCAGRPGSDNGEWTEHRLKTRLAASHARTAGGTAEGRRLGREGTEGAALLWET